MRSVKVSGISSKGTERTMNYVYPLFAKDDFEAIATAVNYANDEYTCEWDENGKLIPNSEFKEFVKITKVEILED